MQMIAAVDVGSNAIRMVVGEVDDELKVRPVENIRLPVRLDQDVFKEKKVWKLRLEGKAV